MYGGIKKRNILIYIFSSSAIIIALLFLCFLFFSKEAKRISDYKYLILYGITTLILFSIALIQIYNLRGKLKRKESQFESARKEIERLNKYIDNLTRLYNSALEYDGQKTEFFSNISHELKTPLSVILGAIQLLDQYKPTSLLERRRSAKHISIIRQNSYRLLRLINNFLDITRIDSGFAKVNMVNCNIVYLTEEITQSVVPYAVQKELTLEFDTDVEEIRTAVDVDKIERILLNLLSNAIKFTPPKGRITVKVWEENKVSAISVKDTGSGIPKAMLDKIFERFRQVNSPLTREYEGSGIGLSLVKSFVELHNGNIEVISEENKGSEFIIRLPVRLINEAENQIINTPAADQHKIIQSANVELSDIYSSVV
ncbi:MAG: HAMP domain-containing sensor histidine kinase [Bacillota bacterium]|nr:HAMP domain-containing sensor histidine kinase [Bacillota bacterium]